MSGSDWWLIVLGALITIGLYLIDDDDGKGGT